MKAKSFFIAGVIIVCSLSLIPQLSFSQRTKPFYVEAGASLNLATYYGDPMPGAGIHFKLLRPLNKNNDALTGGLDLEFYKFAEEIFMPEDDYKFLLASIGYRKRIHSFYIEPQLGGGLFHEGGYNAPCVFAGIEPGIQKNRFSYAISYRFVTVDGIEFGEYFHLYTFKVGYSLFGHKK